MLNERLEFRSLPLKSWFEWDKKLYQKLENFNGSNAYCFSEGKYAYIQQSAKVMMALGPRHIKYEIDVANAAAYIRAGLSILEP